MRNPEHHDRTTTLPLQSASSFNDGISDPLFSSEPSLIQTSFLESSYNFVEHSTSPSIQPISSPLPLDDDKPAYEHENAISEPTAAPPMLAIRRTSPKPTKNETTNGDQSKDNNNKSEKHFDTSFLGLGEQESRFEFQSELSSFAEGNVSDLGISDKNRSEHHQAKVKEGDAQKEKSTNFTLKQQEKTIDVLNKECFGLKLKIYHLEKQLNKVAPEHVDQALRENVNLKVQVSTLSRELQRYKKMLLDSHKAMSILQRNQQTCTKPHISPEEEDEYHAARLEAAQFRDENERLQKLINELSADNNKLRASARSSRNSSPLMEALRVSRSNSNSSGRHSDDLDPDHWNYRNNGANYELELCRRELRQANQKIERQNQIIQSLRDERSVVRGGGGTYDAGSDHLVKTILTNRDELARTNTEIREELVTARERNAETMSQLLSKEKELDTVTATLHETRMQLKSKTSECQHLRQEIERMTGQPNKEDRLDRLHEKLQRQMQERELHQEEIERLRNDLLNKEEEFEALESQVVKIVNRAEKLEREKELLEQKLEDLGGSNAVEELERLQLKIHAQSKHIQKLELHMEGAENHESDIATLEERFSLFEDTIHERDEKIHRLEQSLKKTVQAAKEAKQMYEREFQELEKSMQMQEQTLRERDVRIAALEGHFEAHTDAVEREKAIYQEEIRELEEQVRDLSNVLREKDNTLQTLEGQYKQRSTGLQYTMQAYEEEVANMKEMQAKQLLEVEEEWSHKMAELENRLKETETQLKKDRRRANEMINELLETKRDLQQKLNSAAHRIKLLSDLVNEMQHSVEGGQSDQSKLLAKLNNELQTELDDRNRALCSWEERAKELEIHNSELQGQLAKRTTTVTRLIEKLESTKERKAVMEGVLLRQATDDLDYSY